MNYETDTTDKYPGIELPGQYQQCLEKFCFLDDTIKTRTGVFDSAVARRNDEVTFLTSRAFPLGAISRSYSTCVCNVMLYGSDTWLVKEDSAIKLE